MTLLETFAAFLKRQPASAKIDAPERNGHAVTQPSTEQPVQTAKKSVVEADPLLRALLGVAEAVLVIDPDLRVRLHNEQAVELFGANHNWDQPRLIDLTRNQEIHALIHQTLEQGRGIQARVQLSVAPISSQDKTVYIRTMPVLESPISENPRTPLAPLAFDQRGQLASAEIRNSIGNGRVDRVNSGVTGVVVSFHDLTQLERLERVRREFFANLSHDIRTPLTSIMAYVETLLDGALEDQENNVRFLEIVQRNAIRLSNLINDYSDLSLIESGGLKLRLEPVRLDELMKELAVLCQDRCQTHEITLKLEVPAELTVTADRQRLEQILSNLLDNAIKFNRPGGEVLVAAEPIEDGLIINVCDTGSGITPFDLPRIFERLYRADKARTTGVGGTGLGLAIVKHLVQAHGGTIKVESTPNVGSVFQIKLPTV